MGRFITYALATEIRIRKSDLEERIWRMNYKEPELSDERIQQIVAQISDVYEFKDQGSWLHFTFKDSLAVSDIIEIHKAFFDTYICGVKAGDLSELYSRLSGMSLSDALEYAEKHDSYYYSKSELPFYMHVSPFDIDGKRIYVPAAIDVINFKYASYKTDTEDSAESYDFFSELLRYRLHPLKLADAMMVYLSL